MAGPPFLLAVPADLAIHRIGFDLAAMILPPPMPLTLSTPTNELVRMEPGGLEELLAVAASAIAHRVAPESKWSPIVDALIAALQA